MTAEKETTKKNNDLEKVLADYTKAMKVFQKKDYEKAVELLKEFIEKYPTEREFVDRARTYLTICQDRMEKAPLSLKSFEDYYQYGLYKTNQGHYKEALEALNKANEMKPKEGKILYFIADVYALMKDEDNCLEYLKKAIQIDKFYGTLAQNEVDFEDFKQSKKFKLITRLK
ncbi:MAG: tetratricopeptide repeat protein [Candidatus Aminicenantes bacterium]|nr:tetratricopeptide repeat protein [Candidatus Aminicenantes bacterium]